jgi:hypothetical protein
MPMGFGRPARRFGRRLFPFAAGMSPLAPRPRRILREGNLLFEAGQFAQAAPVFENLAAIAQREGLPRAPFFFLRAARANALSGQAQRSVQLFRTGFEILAATGAAAMLFAGARRLLQDLAGTGRAQEAKEVEAIVSEAPGWSPSAAESASSAHPPLPTHCPQCGASIRSDEVDWIDDHTAECTYCGSPVR